MWGQIAGAGISAIAGGIAGDKAKKAARNAARAEAAATAAAIARLEAVGLPTEEAQRIVLEEPQLLEELTGMSLEDTGLRDIKLDPRYKEAQLNQLRQLESMGEEGLGIEDRIAFDQLARQTESGEQARQKSIMQQMAQQGTLDSGTSLIQQLQSSADATQRQQSRGEALAMQAAQARRDAMSKAANLAGNLERTDYGRLADMESASDVIKRRNIENMQDVGNRNVALRQQYADLARQTRDQQQREDRDLARTMYTDQEQRAKDINTYTTGQATSDARNTRNEGTREATQIAGTGAFLGKAIANPKDMFGLNAKEDEKKEVKKKDNSTQQPYEIK